LYILAFSTQQECLT